MTITDTLLAGWPGNLKADGTFICPSCSKATLTVDADTAHCPSEGRSFDVGTLLGLLHQVRGNGKTPPKQKAPPRQSKTESPSYSTQEILDAAETGQDGDARLFCREFGGQYLFDHTGGRWFKWAGHYWMEDYTSESLEATNTVIEIYLQEANRAGWRATNAARGGDQEARNRAEKERTTLLKKAANLQRLSWKRDVLTLAAAGNGGIGIAGTEWDALPWHLPCVNGLVDLRTGELRHGQPDDYIKTVAPVEWTGIDTPCPAWRRFILDIFDGNEDLGDYAQRLFGSMLPGEVVEHTLPVFWGTGSNGKSTLFQVLAHVLGALCGPIQAETLLDQNISRSGACASPDILSLKGRRIVWAAETAENRRLNDARVKILSGNDSLTARGLYDRRPVTFTPTHSLILITNHLPRCDADDFALWRRIALIPFRLAFVDNPTQKNERPRDALLIGKLKAEAPGIIAWLVRGCLEWQKTGLKPPHEVTQATREYQRAEDLLSDFLEQRCVLQRDAEVRAGDLYANYREWAEEMGHKPLSGTKFGRKMKERLDSYDGRTGIFYIGVGLKVP